MVKHANEGTDDEDDIDRETKNVIYENLLED
jgi:hypothetical protein